MMNTEQFKKSWIASGNQLVQYPADIVEALSIPLEAKRLLIESGLPKEAAPFLSFGPQSSNSPLAPASEDWDLPRKFSCYRIIGSTCCGDPICIDESEHGTVIYLNHDKNYEKIFINSSVMQLCESLLAYRCYVEKIIKKNGSDAYLEGKIPSKLRSWIVEKLRIIDEHSMEEGRFWSNELQ